jgi:hypothetical protein
MVTGYARPTGTRSPATLTALLPAATELRPGAMERVPKAMEFRHKGTGLQEATSRAATGDSIDARLQLTEQRNVVVKMRLLRSLAFEPLEDRCLLAVFTGAYEPTLSGLQLPRAQSILGAADIPTPLAASFCHGVGHCNVGSYRERFLDER